jgi:hypothetical protein
MKLQEIKSAAEKKPLTAEQLEWWHKHIIVRRGSQVLNTKAFETALAKGKPFESKVNQFVHLTVNISMKGQRIDECPIPPEIFDWHWPDVPREVEYSDFILDEHSKLLDIGQDKLYLTGWSFVHSLKPVIELKTVRHITLGGDLSGGEYAKGGWTCGVLSFLKMPKLKALDTFGATKTKWYYALKIVDDHLRNGKNLTDCMDDLIEAGYKEYAKL